MIRCPGRERLGAARFAGFSDGITEERDVPQKALCGGIPSPFLEPSPRSWSHFVGVYRQILTTSLKK